MPFPPTELRNLVVDLIKQLGPFAGNVHRTRVSPTNDKTFPIVNVYFNEYSGNALGDANTGVPEFELGGKVLIHIRQSANADLDEWLDVACRLILDALFRNTEFTSAVDISGFNVRYGLTREAEKPIGEAVISLDLESTERFEPIIEDELESVNIHPKDGGQLYGVDVMETDGSIDAGIAITLET